MSGAASCYIGRVGERIFDGIADRAGLIVARPEPDLLGRDRILEFDRSLSPELVSFDKRLPPIGCSVQIKTVRGLKDVARVSLSVAERLAGDPRPTFVCLIRINSSDEIMDMHLIHILGGNLERILKRLRAEFRDGNADLNKKYINFRVSDGVNVDLERVGLRAALIDFVGKDLGAYALEKTRQRDFLGYDSKTRHSFSVTFNPMTQDQFLDGMLGIGSLSVKSFKRFEERFDIRLPFDEDFGEIIDAHLEVSPTPVGKARISAACEKFGAIDDDCDVIMPPIACAASGDMKVLFRSDLYDLIFKSQESSINIKIYISEDRICSVRKIPFAVRLLQSLQDWVEIKITDIPSGHLVLEGKMSCRAEGGFDEGFLRYLDSIADSIIGILDVVAIKDIRLPIKEFLDCSQLAQIVDSYINRPESIGPMSFEVEFSDDFDPNFSPNVRVIFCPEVYLLGVNILLALDGVFSVERRVGFYKFTSVSFKYLDATVLGANSEESQVFRKRIKRITGVDLMIGVTLKASEN